MRRLMCGAGDVTRFPHRTNVSFGRSSTEWSPSHLRKVRTCTTASGHQGMRCGCRRGGAGGAARDVEVTSPGGNQRVEWRDDGLYLTGWAELLVEGRWLAVSA